jgi:hypothetical protein
MSEQQKQDALAHAADLLGDSTAPPPQVLSELWDLASRRPRRAHLAAATGAAGAPAGHAPAPCAVAPLRKALAKDDGRVLAPRRGAAS